VSNISAHTLLSPTRGRLEYNELNINGSYTMTFSTSPAILCAHKLYGPSGAILDMDGMGAAGGPGFSGGASAAGGQADRGVSGGQNFAHGISTGGSGGAADLGEILLQLGVRTSRGAEEVGDGGHEFSRGCRTRMGSCPGSRFRRRRFRGSVGTPRCCLRNCTGPRSGVAFHSRSTRPGGRAYVGRVAEPAGAEERDREDLPGPSAAGAAAALPAGASARPVPWDRNPDRGTARSSSCRQEAAAVDRVHSCGTPRTLRPARSACIGDVWRARRSRGDATGQRCRRTEGR
jgi:hypothetical protein